MQSFETQTLNPAVDARTYPPYVGTSTTERRIKYYGHYRVTQQCAQRREPLLELAARLFGFESHRGDR